MLGDEGFDLGVDRCLQHSPGSFADEFIKNTIPKHPPAPAGATANQAQTQTLPPLRGSGFDGLIEAHSRCGLIVIAPPGAGFNRLTLRLNGLTLISLSRQGRQPTASAVGTLPNT